MKGCALEVKRYTLLDFKPTTGRVSKLEYHNFLLLPDVLLDLCA
jgi:hypothetical protein